MGEEGCQVGVRISSARRGVKCCFNSKAVLDTRNRGDKQMQRSGRVAHLSACVRTLTRNPLVTGRANLLQCKLQGRGGSTRAGRTVSR